MAIEITDANFEELVTKSNKVSIVYFGAVWCGPCKMIGPIVEELATEYADRAIIGKVNVDENPNISVQFGVRNIPTILFIKDNVVVDKQVGMTQKSVLETKLTALL